MYQSFRVKNFRCFKDLQINDLGRVNLIAGKNNTGKTALLEAMYLLTEPLSATVLFDLQKVRGLEAPDRNLPEFWKQFFFNMKSDSKVEVEGTNGQELRKVYIAELLNNADNQELFRNYIRDELDQLASRIDVVDRLNNLTAALELSLTDGDSLRKCFLYSNGRYSFTYRKDVEPEVYFAPVVGRANEAEIASLYSTIELSGDLSQVIDAFAAFDPRIRELRLLSQIWGNLAIVGNTSMDRQFASSDTWATAVNRFCNPC